MKLALLFLAALLEAGGDALVRTGLRANGGGARAGFLAAGGLMLFAYGYTVNVPGWDFGRLLGVYVVFFFVVAQLLAWLVFGQRPTPPILTGGAFIVLGGVILTTWKA